MPALAVQAYHLPIQMYRIPLKQWQELRKSPRKTLKTAARYAAVGTVMDVSQIKLFLFVTAATGLSPTLINVAVSLFMTFAGFYPSRKFAFKDRDTDVRESFRKWMVQWPPTLVVSTGVFTLLHDVADIRMLLTRIIMVATVGPLFFAFTNIWAFATKTDQA